MVMNREQRTNVYTMHNRAALSLKPCTRPSACPSAMNPTACGRDKKRKRVRERGGGKPIMSHVPTVGWYRGAESERYRDFARFSADSTERGNKELRSTPRDRIQTENKEEKKKGKKKSLNRPFCSVPHHSVVGPMPNPPKALTALPPTTMFPHMSQSMAAASRSATKSWSMDCSGAIWAVSRGGLIMPPAVAEPDDGSLLRSSCGISPCRRATYSGGSGT